MTKLNATLPLLLLAGLILTGCSRQQAEYPAGTPEEAIDSAQSMIVNGDAGRLTELIHAENEQMRSLLNQFGRLLGSVQSLGEAVESRFPQEMEQFREQIRQAAEDGTSSPLFSRLVAAGRSSGTNRTFGTSQINREGLTIDTGSRSRSGTPGGLFDGPRSESQRAIINDIIKQLLADPYGWLAEGRDKLDTVYISDDTVSLTWGGRPVLPPFGLIMVEREGRWQLVPPTSYPGVSRFMPRSEDEWFVWGSMIKTLDHVVQDLETDVRAGKVRNMTDLADTAKEKVAIPAMLIVFAYSNLMDERSKADAQPPAEEAAQEASEQQEPDEHTTAPAAVEDDAPPPADDEAGDDKPAPDDGGP